MSTANSAVDSNATVSVQLVSDSWGTGTDSAAVAEIVPVPGQRGSGATATRLSIGVNSAPQPIAVVPGAYTVRLFLPSGDVMAESVSVDARATEAVTFELRRSPHEWLAPEANLGTVQRLPSVARARALESAGRSADADWDDAFPAAAARVRAAPAPGRPSPDRRREIAREMVAQAVYDLDSNAAAVERISGVVRVPQIVGWRWLSTIDPARALPEGRLSTPELVRWWTGTVEPDPLQLTFAVHDERNAKLTAADGRAQSADFISGQRRAFAALRDPTGVGYYAVLPEGWQRTSRSSFGTLAPASVLMTVVVDSVMRSRDASDDGARWRCSTSVDDTEAMTYLGFLYTGQSSAADVLLRQAQDFLFGKTINPVAAAAGAYGLLSYSAATNASERPQWRDWVRNLYSWFPRLPDAAIAMAQMAMRCGESSVDEEIDVEKLRHYALDAVHRGLPYLTFGVNALSEILLLLVRDDEAEHRAGELVESTRRAHALVQQLGRIVAPGEFFTVLRLGPSSP